MSGLRRYGVRPIAIIGTALACLAVAGCGRGPIHASPKLRPGVQHGTLGGPIQGYGRRITPWTQIGRSLGLPDVHYSNDGTLANVLTTTVCDLNNRRLTVTASAVGGEHGADGDFQLPDSWVISTGPEQAGPLGRC